VSRLALGWSWGGGLPTQSRIPGAWGLHQDGKEICSVVMLALLRMAGLAAVALLAAAPVQAAEVNCRRAGVPVGCTAAGPVTPVAGPGGPVANPSAGVGYGAPGAGVRPAAGPGVGPNYGGPANYHPASGPGVGANAGGPVNRTGWR